MLEQLRQQRRLRTVVITVFALLWLVAMLSGGAVRALPLPVPAGGDALAQSLQHSLCVEEGAQGQVSSEHQAALEDWLHSAFPSVEDDAHADHSAHAGPHCLLCIALMPPAAWAVQVAHYPQPSYHAPWQWPTLFPPALQIKAPLPPRGPPLIFRL